MTLDRACDVVSGLGAAANDIAIPAATSESMIRLIRLGATLEWYYASPEPRRAAKDAPSRAIPEVFDRDGQNA
jgi:hypothetical protein